MQLSKRKIYFVALLGIAFFASLIWGYTAMLDRHRREVVKLYSQIEIGNSRHNVSVAFETLARTSALKRTSIGTWEKYFVGPTDDWLLIVDYNSNMVEFAGIVSGDQLRRRPTAAPPWKQGKFEAPTLSH